MLHYILRRIGQAVAVVFGVTVIAFVIIHLLPGGPARGLLGPHASAAQVRTFIVQNGYNKPFFVQYWDYISNVAKGSLGFSYRYGEPVSTLLKQAVPNSVLLVGISYVVALTTAVPIGLLQAARRNSAVDHTFTGLALVGYSMPVFWLGILLILAFSSAVHIFPPEGPQGGTLSASLHQPLALVLPVATLSIVTIALFSRYVRSTAVKARPTTSERPGRLAHRTANLRRHVRGIAPARHHPARAQPARDLVGRCDHRIHF